ncbi:MAG: IS4/IS5 family transposase [Spirochaetia bacterium]|nr:IS4/IS5 family transposase [Spirochaetia bacterium]
MYLGYDVKNGVKYAKICSSRREGNKVISTQKSLGRVLDEQKGIFQNKERGVFTYDVETDTYGKADPSFVPKAKRKDAREKLILDFGDSYFLEDFIRKNGLWPCIKALGYGNPDTVAAMVHYYVLCNLANCHASDWWDGNYARILYPDANLSSQRISDMLGYIGEERFHRDFFKEYSKLLIKRDEGTDILIDSTGLPNSIHFPLTAISNHNGKISNEMRLIYVLQQGSWLPLAFRYCAGNVNDVSTLTKTTLELKAYGINVKFAILDAGYLTKENIEELFENGISFLSRLKENTKLYKDVLSEHLPMLEAKENLVSYNSRYAYIKRIDCEIGKGHKAYGYLCQDLSMRSIENSKLFEKAEKAKMKADDVFEAMSEHGLFMFISSRPIEKEKVLGTYYTRQQIEQVFDICKNYTNMLPLRVQSEETLRGHLMLSFIAAAIVRMLQMQIKETPYSPIDVFTNLRNHKCKVFDDCLQTQESVKKANDIYTSMNMKIPHRISLKQEVV